MKIRYPWAYNSKPKEQLKIDLVDSLCSELESIDEPLSVETRLEIARMLKQKHSNEIRLSFTLPKGGRAFVDSEAKKLVAGCYLQCKIWRYSYNEGCSPDEVALTDAVEFDADEFKFYFRGRIVTYDYDDAAKYLRNYRKENWREYQCVNYIMGGNCDEQFDSMDIAQFSWIDPSKVSHDDLAFMAVYPNEFHKFQKHIAQVSGVLDERNTKHALAARGAVQEMLSKFTAPSGLMGIEYRRRILDLVAKIEEDFG